MYTAIKVQVVKQGSTVKSYTLSVHGGSITAADHALSALLKTYAAGESHNIQDITAVQRFLRESGHGLSNIILVSASEPVEIS
jgi:hypothetical protein